jgi:hypothetical protein
MFTKTGQATSLGLDSIGTADLRRVAQYSAPMKDDAPRTKAPFSVLTFAESMSDICQPRKAEVTTKSVSECICLEA